MAKMRKTRRGPDDGAAGRDGATRPTVRPPAAAARPSVEELLALGMICRKCHCADLRVYKTVQLPGMRVRRTRRCRYCGWLTHTVEKEGAE